MGWSLERRRGGGSVRVLLVAVVVALLGSGVGRAAETEMTTYKRCGYTHRVLPDGPLDTQVFHTTYALYGRHMSCAATRRLLKSRTSRLPDKPMMTPTAVLDFQGTEFACQSGDAGGGDCVGPYTLKRYPDGDYGVVTGQRTRRVVYRNCSFSGACTKTIRLPGS